jgi:hypothetical protein
MLLISQSTISMGVNHVQSKMNKKKDVDPAEQLLVEYEKRS